MTLTIIDRAAVLLDAHAGMTDRAAEDGCRCGYPGTDEGRHQAEQLANAGLLSRPLPDRDEIARAIFDAHNRLGRSDYDGLPRETSLKAADAVLALLKGQPQ